MKHLADLATVDASRQSPPARGRELKQLLRPQTTPDEHVAPCAGAGIETLRLRAVWPGGRVAPCAGAGIETRSVIASESWRTGRPLRGGGN